MEEFLMGKVERTIFCESFVAHKSENITTECDRRGSQI